MTVLVPWPKSPEGKFPVVPEVNYIDREVFAQLRKLNLVPSELSDDSEFLRRVHIDVIGKLPTPDEVRAFLAGKDPQKRQKKIDELLNHPLHAALWARRLAQVAKVQGPHLHLTKSRDPRWEQMALEWFRRAVSIGASVVQTLVEVL